LYFRGGSDPVHFRQPMGERWNGCGNAYPGEPIKRGTDRGQRFREF